MPSQVYEVRERLRRRIIDHEQLPLSKWKSLFFQCSQDTVHVVQARVMGADHEASREGHIVLPKFKTFRRAFAANDFIEALTYHVAGIEPPSMSPIRDPGCM